MIQKIKIDLWDIFVYFITGIFLIINLTVIKYQIITNLNDKFQSFKLPNFIISCLYIVIPIIIGYLFEPFSNLFGKICKKIFWFNDIKKWESNINKQQEEIKKYITKIDNEDNVYHYCKNYLTYNEILNPSMAFLSKFGFYRNIAFIFFLNSIYLIYLSFHSTFFYLFAVVVSIFLSQLYLHRGFDFYCHLTQTVFQNFLIAKQENDKKGLNKRVSG